MLHLYLAVSKAAVSAALVKEEGKTQKPVFYSSKSLLDAETRYSDTEKAVYALVMASRKLRPYFEAHTINVVSKHSIRTILQKPDQSGRMILWGIELSAFDIRYSPQLSKKGQVFADFILNDFDVPGTVSDPDSRWTLIVDGSSNHSGAGGGILIITPDGTELEMAVKFKFTASNNEAEYEALLAGLRAVEEMGAKNLLVKSDSQLIVNQTTGDYETRDDRMTKYQAIVREELAKFTKFEIIQIPRGENAQADALANLASTMKAEYRKTIPIEVLEHPSIEVSYILSLGTTADSWMTPIIRFLKEAWEPEDRLTARKLRQKATRYWLSEEGHLYRKSYQGPSLKCLASPETDLVLQEVHEGTCGNHSGGRALALKVMHSGYYWPSLSKEAELFSRRCDKCQRFAPLIHMPGGDLNPIIVPWPFCQWGMDIVGPLPTAPAGKRFLLVATDYFTKWVEAEAYANIKETQVKKFIWKNIICRFGIPKNLVTDNGTQFESAKVQDFCKSYGIKNYFSTPRYPQCNGQAESSNKTILDMLKKRLEKAKGKWVEELPGVLWAYRTTKKRATGETPFSLAYGTEAVIPVEMKIPTLRANITDIDQNQSKMLEELDLCEEKREQALIRLETYQRQLQDSYGKKVRFRPLSPGDQVYRRVFQNTKSPGDGKLGPNWEGPYKVKAKKGEGSYELETMEGRSLARPWNIWNLKKHIS